jgi:trans-aconitate methyltransferase
MGIDASAEMIEEAKRAYPNLKFQISDARTFVAAEPFDAIFSNAVLHWIKPPERVVARIAENLKPSGRLVAEFGGKGNIQTIERAIDATLKQMSLPQRTEGDYNYFPGIAEYGGLLELQGLEMTYATLFDRMTALKEGEAGLRNWVMNFRNDIVGRVPEALRSVFFRGVEERSREALYRDGNWSADYRRIRVVARKPV